MTKKQRRKGSLGNPVAVRALRTGGYPKKIEHGCWALMDGHGKIVGRGDQKSCTKIRPGQPGSWIDSQRCTYNFHIADAGKKGAWYACRGYGEGVSVSCRRMLSAPRKGQRRCMIPSRKT